MSTGGLLTRRDAFEEVIIGTQIWMKRNYDFGGTYPNNDEVNVTDYGRLYTWAEASAITFPGWHLPTSAEMVTLVDYLGGAPVAGGHLKEIGTTYWDTPNTGADNTSGFSARAAGLSGIFLKLFAQFWTSTELGSDAYVLSLIYDSTQVTYVWKPKTDTLSVRLIKD